MWQEKIYFCNCRDEKLSGILDYPEFQVKLAVLLLGPHPHLGGDMDNNVLKAINGHLETLNSITMRFDYHGTGESQAKVKGHIYDYYEKLEDQCIIQPFVEDAISGWQYLMEVTAKFDIPKILIGYSFGGCIAVRIASNLNIDLKMIITPPFPKYAWHDSTDFHCLMAENDFIKNTTVPPLITTETIKEADHFFRGKETQVCQWIDKIIRNNL